MQSDYMHWAKFKPPVRYQLTASEVPHFRMDPLDWTIADLDLDGASHPRYAPLRERIAARYGVTADQVVAADGTSMANFLAMAALIAPGDEVLIEHPTYEPLLGAASLPRRRHQAVRAQGRRTASGSIRPRCATAMSDRTRLIVLTNLHNPSGALAERSRAARDRRSRERRRARARSTRSISTPRPPRPTRGAPRARSSSSPTA